MKKLTICTLALGLMTSCASTKPIPAPKINSPEWKESVKELDNTEDVFGNDSNNHYDDGKTYIHIEQ